MKLPVRHRARVAAVFIVGALILLAGSFHGNIWFDESYSVALASKSLTEIWRIGSADVHPVLYYVALHLIYLVLGANVTAYRLFSAAGILAVAALGPTAVQRDYGERAGFAFSALVLFSPYYLYIGNQIRMYSWAIFAVALCLLSALRIARSAAAGRSERPGIWAALFCSSFCAACLHYYGALTAFAVNACLLCLLVRARSRVGNRPLLVLLLGAAAQLILYIPWALVLISQTRSVGRGFWISDALPASLFDILSFPFVNDAFTSILEDFMGKGAFRIFMWVGIAVFLALYGLVAFFLMPRARRLYRARVHDEEARMRCRALGWGLGIYAGIIAFAKLLHLFVGTEILYYRYLSIPLVCAYLGLAILFAERSCQDRASAKGALVRGGIPRAGALPRAPFPLALARCSAVLFVASSIALQLLFCASAYAPDNDAAYDCARAMQRSANRGSGNARDVPVLTDRIGFGGVAAVRYPDMPQRYLNWITPWWSSAYECFTPPMTMAADRKETMEGIEGEFVFATQTGLKDGAVNEMPSGLKELLEAGDVKVREVRTFFRPYDGGWYLVALCARDG